MSPSCFSQRYGPWAVVTGAASGIGAAFARELARKAISVVLLDADESVHASASALRQEHSVQTRALCCDLREPNLLSQIDQTCGELDIGLFVANAARSHAGPFLEQELEDLLDALDTNCRATLQLTHHFGRRLVARGRGGMILLSSLSALWGTPLFANYAGTKAYNLALAEALWDELRPAGVDVLGVCPGPTDTPGFRRVTPGPLPRSMPMTSAEQVAKQSLDCLGSGPLCIPGRIPRLYAVLLGKLLSRRALARLSGQNTRRVWGAS